MKSNEKVGSRDRAEGQKFLGSIPESDTNRTVEIIATDDGLEVDEAFTIPWEWIASQHRNLQQAHQCGLPLSVGASETSPCCNPQTNL
jgi:hypothetical protein